jgi:hypothetical protein
MPTVEPAASAPYTMTIGGSTVTAPSTFPVVNPATFETAAGAPDCTRDLLDAAVAAARETQPAWAAQPIAERQRFLGSMADLVDANLPALARPGDHRTGQAPAGRGGGVRFQNSAIGPDLGFYAARSYSLMRPPRTGRRWIRSRERSATG